MLVSSLMCLALNIYFEARGEPEHGQLAVAEVTLQRVDDPRWPSDVCSVVGQPDQFSWVKEPRRNKFDLVAWEHSKLLANKAVTLHNKYKETVSCMDHFHSGKTPKWAKSMKYVTKINVLP